MDTADQAMANRLKLARERKGYKTATEAADAIGVARPTYLGHENGSRGFRAAAPRYAKFFGVNLAWLLGEHGPMTGTKDPLIEAVEILDPDKRRMVYDFIEFLKSKQ